MPLLEKTIAPPTTGIARSNQVDDAPTAVRADIQALRAFAVLAVVLFHLWPGRVPGGFIGVDVFFVISGYLITSQLVRRRRTRGRIGLASFWAARARRLLPASLLVLAVSVVLVVLWAPDVLRAQYLQSIIASTLYVENWSLAFNQVDYLAHDNPPPIAQHYWSLSVEEQFYLIWPFVVIIGTLGFWQRLRRPVVGLVVAITTLGFFSFVLNVWLTASGSPYAYFATPGRFWEFALGALVAVMAGPALGTATRWLAWLLGWGALIAVLFIYGPQTAFPGFAAVIPTVATAVLIAAGPTTPEPFVARLIAARPVQWVGDLSYGIYLWHWPLIIIAPAVLGRPPALLENVGLLVAVRWCSPP